MSDRVALQAWVWDCPNTERAGVTEALSGYVDAEFEGQISLDTGWLVLGRCYFTDEIPRGSAAELAGILREQAPGASWLLWEDPFEGSLGSLHAHTPGWGTSTQNATATARSSSPSTKFTPPWPPPWASPGSRSGPRAAATPAGPSWTTT
jgi:hypothetical protein